MQNMGGLKYSAPNLSVYVLMIFTGSSHSASYAFDCQNHSFALPKHWEDVLNVNPVQHSCCARQEGGTYMQLHALQYQSLVGGAHCVHSGTRA